MSQFFSSLLWYFIHELRLITHGNSFKGKEIIFGYLSNIYSRTFLGESMINMGKKENIALHRKGGKERDRALFDFGTLFLYLAFGNVKKIKLLIN